MPAPPIIGVTGPDEGGGPAWLFTWLAVLLAGGQAVRITPRRPRPIDRLDGLIVGGGADVDPALYGQDLFHPHRHHAEPVLPRHRAPGEPRPRYLLGFVLFPLIWLARKIAGLLAGPLSRRLKRAFVSGRRDADRDALELDLIAGAVRRRLPVLGICRGEQLLNVYFGGSLHQHLTGFYVEDPEVRTFLPRKRVVLAPDTCLAAIMLDSHDGGAEGMADDVDDDDEEDNDAGDAGQSPPAAEGSVRVNALHRQAIDRLGHGLRVAARDRNGIVQAIEHASLPFVIGVQWHPEFLPQMPRQRALFRTLVREARRVRLSRQGREPRASRLGPACQRTDISTPTDTFHQTAEAASSRRSRNSNCFS